MALLDQIKLTDVLDDNSPDGSTVEYTPDPVPDAKPPTRKKPGPKPGSTRKPAAPAARAKTTAAMAKEVAEDLTTMLEVTATMWAVRDQCCAPVLAEQAKPIAHAVAAILERNPRLLARVADAGNAALLMQTVALARALGPVASTIMANHGPSARRADAGIPGVSAPAPNPPAVDVSTFQPFSGIRRAQSA
jgi:hypothetical protein